MKRVFIDIKRRKPLRLNLSFEPTIVIRFKTVIQAVMVLFIVFYFFFGLATAPTMQNVASAQSNDEQRKALEAQLADLENQISQYETKISEYQKQGTSLKSEINKLNSQIAKLNLQIKAVNLTLDTLNFQINDTQNQIVQTQNDIDANKSNLGETLQTLYENDAKSIVEILIANPKLSDFVNDMNNLMVVQDNIRLTIAQIIEDQQKLVDQKQSLGLQKGDAMALKAYQSAQKNSIQQTQTEKNTVLKVTKGQESTYQKLLTDTKKTAAQIRQQIFELLGGGELTFEQAYALAKNAESATGVRAALILAVLDRESALGKNVGRCDYNQIMAGGTKAMSPKETPIFLTLIQSLNIEPNSVKISCPNADGTYGGAMGPAQFMPSTWNIYVDDIASLTGSNPPSPWKNADAFMATALYLKNAGAGPNATLAQEKQAAAKYYAGTRWRNYLSTYGARVIAAAQGFEEDIAILNS